jgi:hypothetical protein
MFSVEIPDQRQLEADLASIPERLFPRAKNLARDGVLKAQRKTVSEMTGKGALRRSGTLARSIQTTARGSALDNLYASVGAAQTVGGKELVYAPVHQKGALHNNAPRITIRAKNAFKNLPGGPYLTVPAPANQTGAGVMRMTPRQLFSGGGKIGTGSSGRGISLFDNNGREMFFLAKKVSFLRKLHLFEHGLHEAEKWFEKLKVLPLLPEEGA